MAKRTRPTKETSAQALEGLVEKAMSEAGVAEAVEVYERTEAVYAALSSAPHPPTVYSANSTSGVPRNAAD